MFHMFFSNTCSYNLLQYIAMYCIFNFSNVNIALCIYFLVYKIVLQYMLHRPRAANGKGRRLRGFHFIQVMAPSRNVDGRKSGVSILKKLGKV